MKKSILQWLVVVPTLVFTLWPVQASQEACAKLLPADALQAAAGKGFRLADFETEEGGGMSQLRCSYMRRGSDGPFATVSVTHYAKVDQPAALFEELLAPHETMRKTKRKAIAGINKRAAFVSFEGQQIVAIERGDAVVRIVIHSLNAAQTGAVAKAVGSP